MADQGAATTPAPPPEEKHFPWGVIGLIGLLGLIPRARRAPQLISSLREQMAELA